MKSILLLLALLLAAHTGFADSDNPVKRKKLAPSETPAPMPDVLDREGETLNTGVAGLDSLNVLPTELETESNGGTRRVKLETKVFKRHEPVHYNASGNRDPFRALVSDERKEGEIKTDLLRMEEAVLTGVVWSDGEKQK